MQINTIYIKKFLERPMGAVPTAPSVRPPLPHTTNKSKVGILLHPFQNKSLNLKF